MKEITLKIPDKRFNFFMDLIKQLGFEISRENEIIEIPEEHKSIVRNRIKKSNHDPKRILDWDKVQDDFKLD